jgi:hypothetical protein
MTTLARRGRQISEVAALVIGAIGCSQTTTTPPGPAASCVGRAPATGLGAYSSAQLQRLVEASYVISATVEQVHASTVPQVDTTTTVIAHIDATIFASAGVSQYGGTWGDRVTIALKTFDVPVGASAIFVTRDEQYNGGQLEVRELDRVDPLAMPSFATDVPKIYQLFAANPLYARIATSAVIAAAHVDTILPAVPDPGASEHSPSWRTADASAEILCGPDLDATSIADAYASSQDIAWYEAPKLAEGQDAVLLAHHTDSDVFGEPAPELFTVDQLDVHALADQPAIQALLDSPPPL